MLSKIEDNIIIFKFPYINVAKTALFEEKILFLHIVQRRICKYTCFK